MKKYKITAANKEHFTSLIRDYRKDGWMIITFWKRFAELKKEDELIVIEY